jgi:hypothetical protein
MNAAQITAVQNLNGNMIVNGGGAARATGGPGPDAGPEGAEIMTEEQRRRLINKIIGDEVMRHLGGRSPNRSAIPDFDSARDLVIQKFMARNVFADEECAIAYWNRPKVERKILGGRALFLQKWRDNLNNCSSRGFKKFCEKAGIRWAPFNKKDVPERLRMQFTEACKEKASEGLGFRNASGTCDYPPFVSAVREMWGNKAAPEDEDDMDMRPVVTIEQLALASYRIRTRLACPNVSDSDQVGQAMNLTDVAKEVIVLRTEISRRPCTAIRVIDHQHQHYITDEVVDDADEDAVFLPGTAQ